MGKKVTFGQLPDLAKIKIFGSLSGGALFSSRLVCREWNKYTLENIWQSKQARKMLKNTLANNWQDPMSYRIEQEFVDMKPCGNGSHALLAACGEFHFVIGYETSSDLIVVNMFDYSIYRIETNLKPGKMRVYVNKIALIYCADHANDFGEAFDTFITVVSTKKRQLVLQLFVPSLMSINVESLEDQNQALILVVCANKLQIISYDELTDEIKMYSSAVTIKDLFLTSFFFPYITVGIWNEDNKQHDVLVWKVINEDYKIEEEHKVDYFEDFLDPNAEQDLLIHALFYINGLYIISCCSQNEPETNYVTKVVDKNGVVIREIDLATNEMKSEEILFYPMAKHLFLEQITKENDEGWMYLLETDEVLNPDVKDFREALT